MKDFIGVKSYSTPGNKMPASDSEYTGGFGDIKHLVDLASLFSLWTMVWTLKEHLIMFGQISNGTYRE